MALTINCCLKPSPSPSRFPQVPLKDQSEWRKRCVATMAWVFISSTAGITDGHDFAATAKEITPIVGSGTGTRMVRWSDKRSCPPWRQNLLENIVPENLPRPSNSRRPNSVTTRRTGGDRDAAVIGGNLIVFDKGCFSL
ncbi:histone deacetylase-like protein [Carex rostrata]